MKASILIFVVLLVGCKKESSQVDCESINEWKATIESSTQMKRDKIISLKKDLKREKNPEWKESIGRTIEATKQSIKRNNKKVRDINTKNQRCLYE